MRVKLFKMIFFLGMLLLMNTIDVKAHIGNNEIRTYSQDSMFVSSRVDEEMCEVLSQILQPAIDHQSTDIIEKVDSSDVDNGEVNSGEVNSGEVDSDEMEYEFDNISDMKMADLTEGSTCKTKGYYTKGDQGRANYIILNSKNKSDGITVHDMNNGLKAVLIIDEKRINVMAAGISTGEKVSDKLNIMLSALNGKVDEIEFNGGRYIIDKPVDLYSFHYIGNENTELFVSEDFESVDDKVFTTNQIYNKTGEMMNIVINNITFLMECSEKHSRYNQVTIMLQFTGIESCLIENCRIISYQAETDGCYMPVVNVAFRGSDLSNITIHNSTFENLTGTATDDDIRVIGGCLRFRGRDLSDKISNICISDSSFINTTNDEALSIWDGTVENVLINNVTFEVKHHRSDNIFAIYNSNYSNLVISDCSFKAEVTTVRAIKSFNNVNADFTMTNCDISINSNIDDPWGKQICVFYFFSNEKTRNDNYTNRFIIKDCEIVMNKGTVYRTVFESKNVLVTVKDTNIQANIALELLTDDTETSKLIRE